MNLVNQIVFSGTAALCLVQHAVAFEGRISATITRGGETQTLLYTVGTNCLRIERTETNRPHARNLVSLETGDRTLLFPHNRSFVRLKPTPQNASPFPGALVLPPGIGPQTRAMPGAAAGVGPTNLPVIPSPPPMPHMPDMPALPQMPTPPASIGPTNLPGMPAMPAIPQMPAGLPPGIGPQRGGAPGAPTLPMMPGMAGGMAAMPMMPMMPVDMREKPELKATGEKTNLLGYACNRYELKQAGEIMEIWATDQLFPFEAWRQNQPPRFGARIIEAQWPELVKADKRFPLLATLKFENGVERYRFEVKAVKAEKVVDAEGRLFQPPPDYQELPPLPF